MVSKQDMATFQNDIYENTKTLVPEKVQPIKKEVQDLKAVVDHMVKKATAVVVEKDATIVKLKNKWTNWILQKNALFLSVGETMFQLILV